MAAKVADLSEPGTFSHPRHVAKATVEEASVPPAVPSSAVSTSTRCPSELTSGAGDCTSVLSEALSWTDLETVSVKAWESEAKFLCDTPLVLLLMEMARLPPVDSATVKLLLRAVHLLRVCDYPTEDICSTLAHASAYFSEVHATRKHRMAAGEAGYIFVVLIYMAHSYVQDEACSLKTWHDRLFHEYCSIATLDQAIMQLMRLRGYVLRLDREAFMSRYERLLACAEGAKASSG